MKWFCLAIVLVPAAALAAEEPKDVFPPKVDGIEYRLSYGRTVRPGWHNGLKYSDKTKAECERRLAFAGQPVVCMVREQLEI